MLLGRLGKDPETKNISDNLSVTSFSVATSENWKDKEGKKQERTTWLNCVAFGKLGENIAKFFGKGDMIFVEGSIRIETVEKDEETKYYTKIMVSSFSFVGSGKGSAKTEGSGTSQEEDSNQMPYEGSKNKVDDDLPF